MQRAVRIVHGIALAQRVEPVALARVQFSCHGQRVDDARRVGGQFLQPRQGKLPVEEFHVERGVMDDQLRAADVVHEFPRNIGEFRLVGKELERQAVDLGGALVYLALRIEVTVELPVGDVAAEELDAADLDHPVAHPRVQAGGFRIEDDLPRCQLQSPCLQAHRRARSRDARRALSPNATRLRARARYPRASSTDRRS